MSDAKRIHLEPISAADARAAVKRLHYSGKVVNNSQFHVGAFWNGKLEGAMSFGPSLDKRKLVGLVEGTAWNGFVELNRMAFSDALPRNSESRAIAVAMRILRTHAPHLKWVVTFADAAQCGDGTIYRASGFVLTGIKQNNQMWALPNGFKFSRATATKYLNEPGPKAIFAGAGIKTLSGGSSMSSLIEAGAKPIPGFQLRYLYFLDPTARERLTVPILPFSEIQKRGASMYCGKPRATSIAGDVPGLQPGEGGSIPTVALSQGPQRGRPETDGAA